MSETLEQALAEFAVAYCSMGRGHEQERCIKQLATAIDVRIRAEVERVMDRERARIRSLYPIDYEGLP